MNNGFENHPRSSRIALPGHAVWLAVDRMSAAAARVESQLSPSFFKKLKGNGGREADRAVVAAAFEESNSVRRTLIDSSEAAIQQASGLEAVATADRNGSEAARQAALQARAMAGMCDRFKIIVDRWRDAASAHQENQVGSTEQLLNVSKRFQALAKEIRTPTSGHRT